jgi:hypothetical protein
MRPTTRRVNYNHASVSTITATTRGPAAEEILKLLFLVNGFSRAPYRIGGPGGLRLFLTACACLGCSSWLPFPCLLSALFFRFVLKLGN